MFTNLYKKLKPILWFLPGFLLWAAFPPMGERMDCLFALAPLMWLSRREVDAKRVAKRWFQSGIFFWVATLSWMPAIVKNGGPWPLVVLGWFALAAYCALYFWLYGWLSARYWRWAKFSGNRTIIPIDQSDNLINRTIRTIEQSTNSYWKRLLGVFLVEPVLWCGLELVRSRFLGGFAWNQLGVVPVNSGFGTPAALGGVYLCSAVVILINGTIAGIAERVWRPERSGFANLKRMGPLETLLAFGLVWGVYAASGTVGRPQRDDRSGREMSLKVALIQRNFPCVFKAQEENPYEAYDKLLDNVAMLKPDLVVLPESAMCEFGPVDQQGAVRFAEWVAKKTGGAALLAGGTRYEEGLTYNSAALYGGDNKRTTAREVGGHVEARESGHVETGESGHVEARESGHAEAGESGHVETSVEVYDKVHLVPFGEFIPGDKLFPALQKLAPVGSCTPGELKLLPLNRSIDQSTNRAIEQSNNLNNLNNRTIEQSEQSEQSNNRTILLGCAICFEDTDSALMRALAAKGARVLFFVTNDSWFSHSVEAEQHAWQAVARAVETGLPVVRVGNSGVTGTLAPDGRTSWLIGADGRPLVDRRGTMFDRIEMPDAGCRASTLYVRLGDVPLFCAFALLIGLMILIKYTHHYE